MLQSPFDSETGLWRAWPSMQRSARVGRRQAAQKTTGRRCLRNPISKANYAVRRQFKDPSRILWYARRAPYDIDTCLARAGMSPE
jgi:hypothetical protein